MGNATDVDMLINDPFFPLWTRNYEENVELGIFKKCVNIYKIKTLSRREYCLVCCGDYILDNQYTMLKTYRKKNSYLFCIDIALPSLIEHKIIPDFVVTLDPQGVVVNFIEDIDTTPLCLIASTCTHPSVFKHWRGKIFLYNQTDEEINKKIFFKKLTKSTKRIFGPLKNVYYVGNTAIQVANLLNPHEYILFGYSPLFQYNPLAKGIVERYIQSKDRKKVREFIIHLTKTAVSIENASKTKTDLILPQVHLYHTKLIELTKELKIINKIFSI